MAATLLLDRTAWDLCLTSAGDIALATEPYSLEQDVASECRVFQGECYYDTTRGLPYRSSILGSVAPIQLLKDDLKAAAERVDGVTGVTVYLTQVGRAIGGQVQFSQGTATL